MHEFSGQSKLAAVVKGAFVKDFCKRLLKLAGMVEHFLYLIYEVAVTQEKVDVLSIDSNARSEVFELFYVLWFVFARVGEIPKAAAEKAIVECIEVRGVE